MLFAVLTDCESGFISLLERGRPLCKFNSLIDKLCVNYDLRLKLGMI